MLAGALVVVPNYVVAQQIRWLLEQNCLNSGEEVWITPEVITLDVWLRRLWLELGCHETVVLSSYEEKLLWRQLLAGSLFEQYWPEVRDFYIWLNEYYATTLLNEPWDEELSLLFRLIGQFRERLNQLKATTVSDLPQQLLARVHIIKPVTINWVGFVTELPPALEQLLTVLRSNGVKFKTEVTAKQPQMLRSFIANDEVHELQEALLWLKQRYLEHSRYLGLVIPQLREPQKQVLRSLATQILGQHGIPWKDTTDEKTALEVPLLREIGGFLDCAEKDLTADKIVQLLISPYSSCAQTQPNSARQQLAETMLFSSESVEQLQLPPDFRDRLVAAQRCLPEGLTATPLSWANCFTAILNVWGWPNLLLNFTEQEAAALTLWPEILTKFSAVDSSFGELSIKEALWLLEAILESSYLPGSQLSAAAINFVTPGTALALPFDDLWWSGCLFGQALLQAKQPSWLPKNVIERYQNQPDEQTVIAKLLSNIRGKLVLSGAHYNMRGEELEMNEALTSLPPLEATENISQIDEKKIDLVMAGEIDSLPAWPELTAFNSHTCALIARCPVQAFLELRFNTENPELFPNWGIGRLERGIVIHRLLEQFWRQIRSQQNLLSLSTEEITQEFTQNFRKIAAQNHWSAVTKELEEVYLLPLLVKWLNFEKKRPAFTVLSLEENYQLKLGDLTLNLRVDRIDELDNGELMLIDYKTGLQHFSLAKWLREPLLEPQLMLYHLAEPKLTTLAIAELNHEAMALHSFGLKELNSTWKYLNAEIEHDWNWDDWEKLWQQQLLSLLQDFRNGQLPPQPTDRDSCKKCYLKSFCQHLSLN